MFKGQGVSHRYVYLEGEEVFHCYVYLEGERVFHRYPYLEGEGVFHHYAHLEREWDIPSLLIFGGAGVFDEKVMSNAEPLKCIKIGIMK